MNSAPPQARTPAGFSLIEVVVAMTLLIFVIGALSILATRTSERARRADIIAKRNVSTARRRDSTPSRPPA
jgi:Tfp pilus assembly protein PilV